jgi:protein kinase C substrate 80K-H
MNLFSIVFLFLSTFTIAVSEQPGETTFGVKPSEQHLYDSKPFKCDSGSKILKQKQINDDYCDCKDGADEPGTSACDNGKFWCENTGHVGQYIFSSRVNDGICDCCDGTDEKHSHKVCEDNCWETGKETRRLQEEENERRRIGLVKKQELIEKAKLIVEENKAKLQNLKSKLDTLSIKKDQAVKNKDIEEIIEKEEKEIMNKDGYNNLIKSLGLDNVIYPRLQKMLIDFAKEQEKENELVDFLKKTTGNLDIPIIAKTETVEVDVNGDGSSDDPMDPLKKYDLDNMNSEELLAAADQILADTQKVIDDNLVDKDNNNLDSTDFEQKVDEESTEGNPSSDGSEAESDETERIKTLFATVDSNSHERPEAATARGELVVVEREFNEAEQAVKALEGDDFSGTRYGENNEYLPYKDECFEKMFQGYNYRFCFYGEAKQDTNNLGSWDGFVTEEGITKAMFKNGATCWNGPSRSLHVTLQCGSENNILDVYEPSMCEYHMKFSTPASC